jgi:hypothetical protein
MFGTVDTLLNAGTGPVSGGVFYTGGNGTGTKTAVQGYSQSWLGNGSNTGGSFIGEGAGGSGERVGIEGYGYGTASDQAASCIGIRARGRLEGVLNVPAYGGYFVGYGGMTGPRYGIYAGGYCSAPVSRYGVYAEGGLDGVYGGTSYGVYATAKADGNPSTSYAVYALANKVSSYATNYGVYAQASGGPVNWAGYFNGNFIATNGTKNAGVKIDEGDWRLLYAQESPEVWFEDVGRGRLQNGKARIELEPVFLKTVTVDERHPMEIFVQLRGDCKGVYVLAGSTSFDVIELQGGTSNADFTYRVMAKRKGYEDTRLKRMEPGTTPDDHRAEQEKMRVQRERDAVPRQDPGR